MPIVALPQTTVRAIGSTSVISDPCSVVKELIDNCLDASATSIQVELTQNTLDVIQVKDNGHGIPTEDHSNVCKHTFTSKIQTVDDLKNVGGIVVWLPWRGLGECGGDVGRRYCQHTVRFGGDGNMSKVCEGWIAFKVCSSRYSLKWHR